MLLIQSVQRLERDLNETRKKLTKKEEEISEARKDYHMIKENYAVLRERLNNNKQSSLLKHVLITLGGISLGLCIPEYLNNQSSWSLIGSLIGVVMLLAGWFINSKEEV